ncbi:MAG: 50S ribosomal protein L5 [Parcubacteria group bacterium GW2011_GWA2_52_8]|nr:MAG: 50S ribosomal protein L5 [Parcubacteria group bacterium GW2011_GWA2_52_8]
MTRLLERYRSTIVPQLQTELKLSNRMAVPRIEKIVVNAGLGKPLVAQPKNLEAFTGAFRKIVGQQPLVTKARKAISAFKIREGQIVGLAATLRGKRMYDFLDKLVNVALPRARDFRGIPRSGFDGRGNYSLGLREHVIFPEMAQEEVASTFGLQVTVVTKKARSQNRRESRNSAPVWCGAVGAAAACAAICAILIFAGFVSAS